MAVTTSTLSETMQNFYDKVFLERADVQLRFDVFAQKKVIPKNSGKVVYFTKYTPLTAITSATTEGSLPSAVNLSASNVSATAAEYSSYAKISKLFELTTIDDNLKEAVEVMGQNAGESIDTLIAAELSANATAQLAGSNSALSDIAATDTLSSSEIKKAVRTLKTNKAQPMADGFFGGYTQPYTSYDLMGDSQWLDAQRYTDPSRMYKGEIGRIWGVRFVETNNGTSESSTVTVYHNYVCGKESYGVVNLADGEKKIYVKRPGANSTDNPVDNFSTVGWVTYFVPKILDSNWVINVKTGATA